MFSKPGHMQCNKCEHLNKGKFLSVFQRWNIRRDIRQSITDEKNVGNETSVSENKYCFGWKC